MKTLKVSQVRGAVLGSCLQSQQHHLTVGVSICTVKNLTTVGDPGCHRGQACGAETQAYVGEPVAGS